MSNFFFIGLPYAAVIIMLVGTIYRYRITEFKYSSLSTQFLEGKTLHKGIHAFHIGIIFLFFGHLIGFLFPSAIYAWNGTTMRLLIIEISAFAFAMLTLYGLLILIVRRVSYRRIFMLTSPMDITVNSLLLIQIISGMWVAYTCRWGTSWYASAIVPYLYSIFVFNPDVATIIAMPLAVKIHIASAFIIIGMVPFTRLVHFLIYPIHYVWRNTQRVVWYWNRKEIRNSEKINPAVKAKNN